MTRKREDKESRDHPKLDKKAPTVVWTKGGGNPRRVTAKDAGAVIKDIKSPTMCKCGSMAQAGQVWCRNCELRFDFGSIIPGPSS